MINNKLKEKISNSINESLSKLLRENANTNQNGIVTREFNDNMVQYFENADYQLSQQKEIFTQMKAELDNIENVIVNLDFTYNLIDSECYEKEYNIYYYIDGSENWSEEDYMKANDYVDKQFTKLPFNIQVFLEDNDNRYNQARIVISYYDDEVVDYEI